MKLIFVIWILIASSGVGVQGKALTQPEEQYSVSAAQTSPVVILEDDVIMGNTLPPYGTLCQDAAVQGNPHDGFEVLYTLPAGETVQLREQSHGPDRSWVMIKAAHWIKIDTLCGFGGDDE